MALLAFGILPDDVVTRHGFLDAATTIDSLRRVVSAPALLQTQVPTDETPVIEPNTNFEDYLARSITMILADEGQDNLYRRQLREHLMLEATMSAQRSLLHQYLMVLVGCFPEANRIASSRWLLNDEPVEFTIRMSPRHLPCRPGHEVLEDLFGLPRNLFCRAFPHRRLAFVEQVSVMARHFGKSLPRGALFFWQEMQPCWYLDSCNVLSQVCTANALYYAFVVKAPAFVIRQHPRTRRRSIRILEPIVFPEYPVNRDAVCLHAVKTHTATYVEIRATLQSHEVRQRRHRENEFRFRADGLQINADLSGEILFASV
jgi:hypothetical protein